MNFDKVFDNASHKSVPPLPGPFNSHATLLCNVPTFSQDITLQIVQQVQRLRKKESHLKWGWGSEACVLHFYIFWTAYN